MKKVICAKDISVLVSEGKTALYVDDNMIVTPSARDAAKQAGLEIRQGCEPCQEPVSQAVTAAAAPAQNAAAAPAAVPAPTADGQEISSDMIYKVLQALIGKGRLDDMIGSVAAEPAAPYTAETHDSGLKLVRGQGIEMAPLDVGVPGSRVFYQEIVGKADATTSCGFLEIEKSRFNWELEYEETDYVVEGTMTVEVDGKTFTATAGDTFFLPKGSKVVMGSPDRCKVFYTTYPAL